MTLRACLSDTGALIGSSFVLIAYILTLARDFILSRPYLPNMERETGFEPATLALATLK